MFTKSILNSKPEHQPVLDLINSLSKGVTPYSMTIRLSDEPKFLRMYNELLFIALKNGEIIVYSLKTNKIIKNILTGEKKLSGFAVDRLTKRLFVIGSTPFVHLWDFYGSFISKIEIPNSPTLTNAEFAFESVYITDSEGKIYRLTSAIIQTVKAHSSKITNIACNEMLATCSHDCSIKLWQSDLSSIGELLSSRPVHRLCFISPTRLSSAGTHSLFCIWDLTNFSLLCQIQSEENWVRCITASPCSTYIISGTNDACVRYWYIANSTEDSYESFIAHEAAVTNICVNDSGSLVVTGSKDRTVKIWQTCNEVKKIVKLKGHEDVVNCLAVGLNEQFVYSGSADSSICKWDIESNEVVVRMKDHMRSVSGLEFWGEVLLSVSEDGTLKVWENDGVRHSLNLGETLLSLCIGGNFAFVGGRSGKIYVVNKSFQKAYEINAHLASVSSMVYKDYTLYSGSYDRTIKAWDVKTFNEKFSFKAHNSAVKRLMIMPEGDKLISIGGDKAVKVWFHGLKPLELPLNQHLHNVQAIGLNSNGWYTLSGDSSGQVIFWCNNELINICKIELGASISAIVPLKCEPKILIAAGNTIFVRPDILAENILMTIPNKDSYLYFLYLSAILKRKGVQFKHSFKDYLVMPLRINILHILAYIDDAVRIKEAMRSSVKFFSSEGENPLRIALMQKSYQSVDAFLKLIPQYAIKNPYIFKIIEKEIILLFALNLKNLPVFLSQAFPVVKSKHLPLFGKIKCTTALVSTRINVVPDDFGVVPGGRDALEYRGSMFKLPLILGSQHCIEMLQNLMKCENLEVFQEVFVQVLLEYLLDRANKILGSMGILNFFLICLLGCYFVFFIKSLVIGILALAVNLLYLGFELAQAVRTWEYYLNDYWNAIDLLRIFSTTMSVICALSSIEGTNFQILISVCMFFNMIRLISLFRLFHGTRYMIKMIFEIFADIISFLLILLMSIFTIALTLTFAYDSKQDFKGVFFRSYLLTFGQIDFEDYQESWFIECLFALALFLNPLIMMNLLIATMGNTFERVKSRVVVSDYKEMIELILEASSIIIWNRGKNETLFLQCCMKKEPSKHMGDLNSRLKKMKTDIDDIKNVCTESSETLSEILEVLSE